MQVQTEFELIVRSVIILYIIHERGKRINYGEDMCCVKVVMVSHIVLRWFGHQEAKRDKEDTYE